MKPAGDAFQTALWKGYIEKADPAAQPGAKPMSAGGFGSTELFIDKAIMAAKGQTPAPEDPIKHKFRDRITLDDLRSALSRLNAAFAGNSTQKVPEKAAETQVAYDCWLEEAEEGHEPLKMRECREKFMVAMDVVEGALAPVAAAPMPAPAPVKMPGPYVIYFYLNKSSLDEASMAVINQAATDIKISKPRVVNVAGYADTSGSPADNLRLSQKRAEAVAAALRKAGVAALLATTWGGSEDVAIPTGPNVRDARNRRVVIVLGK